MDTMNYERDVVNTRLGIKLYAITNELLSRLCEIYDGVSFALG